MATTSDKKVNVVLTVNSANFSAGINQLKGKLNELGGTSKATSHSMVSDVQASSGALRLLEGGMTGNIRAAERFMASIKGVGAAMQFIYPAVGLIAIGSVVAKAATEMINFTKKTKEAAVEFRASFQEMQNSARLSNDELARTNINLENQIAILTGKHENVAAAELNEARIQADNLAISAAHAAKEIKELLEKGQGTFLTKALSAGGSTELFGNINNFQNLKSQARQDQEDALHSGDTKGAAAASARYDQLIKNERAYLKEQRDFRSGTGPRDGAFSGNQSTNLTAINGALGLNYSQGDRTDEDAQNLIEAARVKKLEDAKKFSEAQKTAAAKQMASYDKQFANLTGSLVPGSEEESGQFEARKLTEEAMFWSKKLSLAKHGSLVYQDIQEKLAEIDVRSNQQYATAVNEHINLAKERDKFVSQSFGSDLDLTRNSDVMGELKGGGKDAGSMLTAMNEGVTIARSNADAWADAQIQIGQAAGTLGKYDAALQTLQLHRQQNDRANSDLSSSRAALEQRYGPEASATTPEARAAYAQLNNQQAGLNGQYRVQSAQDQQSVNEQTPLGAWKTSLDQFVQQSRDTASQVRDIWSSALSSVNEEIVKIISTKHNPNTRMEFGNLGAGMFRSVASAGLQKGEGALLGALHLGGSKGLGSSQANAMWVRMTGVAGGTAGSIGSAVSKAAGGIGGFIGKIAGIASGLGFAGGGMPPVGMASLVGENGPELFVPHTAGTVVPNGGFGGGNTHITLGGMDLRGASDPAAFEAIANRVFSKHVPSMISASMQAQRESHARKPSSARS
jgi:hypothetical protein